LSNEAEEIACVSAYLKISAKKTLKMMNEDIEDFYMTLGLAKRNQIDQLKLRGLIK
jgi:hypothetical protein